MELYSTYRDIERARELIANGFTQRVSARDASGKEVSALSSDAVVMCSNGAIWRSLGEAFGFMRVRLAYVNLDREVLDRLVLARQMLDNRVQHETDGIYGTIVNYNDDMDQYLILQIFDKTLEELRDILVKQGIVAAGNQTPAAVEVTNELVGSRA